MDCGVFTDSFVSLTEKCGGDCLMGYVLRLCQLVFLCLFEVVSMNVGCMLRQIRGTKFWVFVGRDLRVKVSKRPGKTDMRKHYQTKPPS